ncbi:MAG TPA: GYDIA family GHMP kinase [Chitinophagales bacterium]|nr:GYDIA family GHMP kinase [Chitinophagales bacterium]
MSQNQFHANGKLLLTGEYFILDGAVGLALPTKFGQTLTIEPSEEKGITWKSLDHENNIWFEAKFNESLEIISATDNEVATTLKNILSHCNLTTYYLLLTTKLDFPQNWGLGSSSTLISLLAQYANIDPYELLAKTFGGSGYDIACATAKSAIIYQLNSHESRITTEINFNPSFKENLYFVYLGKKQNSREGIRHYKNLTIDKTEYIEQISNITKKIIEANELDEFCYYLDVHENIVANVLNLPKVKDIYLADFPGSIKSLGAWGGDFILVASDENLLTINKYFTDKGFPVILSYNEMIL